MKRPIVIEFSGLPNSGKTTLLHNLQDMCSKNGINVLVVQEKAELLPNVIPKGSIEQNLWITLETLQSCIQLKYIQDVDYILLDRGFYNQYFWARMYEDKNKQYSSYIIKLMEEFAKNFDARPDFLFIIDVDINESIRRRKASNDGIVTFSKVDFLEKYKEKFTEFYKNLDLPNYYLNTTYLTPIEVANEVLMKIKEI